MQQSTLFLLFTAYLLILTNSQIVCPPGLYDDQTAGFCKTCSLDADLCGSNPSCPEVYRAKDSIGADLGC
jgi:hypothetical protein